MQNGDDERGERKLTVLGSSTSFLVAGVLTAASLTSPNWVVEDFQGSAKFGIFRDCRESMYGTTYEEQCGLANGPGAWRLAAACLVVGLLCVFVAGLAAAMSYIRAKHLHTARWMGFLAGACYSIACLALPIGFSTEEIGGEAFKLPEYTFIGSGYVLFIISLMSLFVGELFALKVICPARR
jgi:hypothetical protein